MVVSPSCLALRTREGGAVLTREVSEAGGGRTAGSRNIQAPETWRMALQMEVQVRVESTRWIVL